MVSGDVWVPQPGAVRLQKLCARACEPVRRTCAEASHTIANRGSYAGGAGDLAARARHRGRVVHAILRGGAAGRARGV